MKTEGITNDFIIALCSNVRSKRIPEEYDFFGMLIGEWDIIWNDHLEDTEPRRVKGEWIFSRVLDGTAVQDLFIVPSREERLQNKQPDAEYGTTLRIFNPKTMVWDIFYGCTGEAIRLTAQKVGNEIILTENTTKKMRYVFSDIKAFSFLWRKERMDKNNEWQIVAKVTAERKQNR
ncbi:hypothetical protein EII14_09035 [Alloprevotella sp. OH1205_COT-284]|uniref:DUF1579 domain-containing protein n=2 Tax=Porphyromonas TaxID=836 RepID=A0AB34PIM8_9PORP|nr:MULTISPECIES: hypothetical protein [Bacteroidales]KGN96873.1 hypothetical protein HQ38_00910 [Porphyromonas crevioricanis]MBB6275995.1 hypothetical protein [Porphyromonas circumdentaria]MDO4721943.1 hypothetical protein [Porphyromonas circumdentaria]RRD73879.1 hypothetical protein EII14_09035 [Alloprevotella sp. OH1205_COT-284]SJZ72476.1 hypothetical protein SAMN02745171_00958 [Porphyromonas circumdentaria]